MADLSPGGFSPTDSAPPPGALAQTALNTPPQRDPAAGLKSLMGAEQKELAGPQAGLDAAINGPRPERPIPQKVPEAPKQDYSKAAQGFISSSLLLAGLASAFSRNHITTGLNAFAAANKGFHEGAIEAGETAYKQWKQSSDQVIANNNQMLDEYKAALEDRKATIAEQSQRIAVIASKYKDKFTFEAALMHNQQMYAQLYEQIRYHTDQLAQNKKTMEQRHDDHLDDMREKLAVKGLTLDDNGKIVRDPNLPGAGNVTTQIFDQFMSDFRERYGREANAQEQADFRKKNLMAQPRSPSAMFMQKELDRIDTLPPEQQGEAMAKANAHFKTMAAASAAFAPGGVAGKSMNSINTAINHLDSWEELALKANKGDSQALNSLANSLASAFGDPDQTNAALAAQFVGPEIVKSLTASGGGVEERRDIIKNNLGRGLSPQQIRGARSTAQEFLAGRVEPLKLQYIQGEVGSEEDFLKLLSPRAQQIFANTTAGQARPEKAVPDVGTVEDGHRFKGGNPANPSSWEKVQ